MESLSFCLKYSASAYDCNVYVWRAGPDWAQEAAASAPRTATARTAAQTSGIIPEKYTKINMENIKKISQNIPEIGYETTNFNDFFMFCGSVTD